MTLVDQFILRKSLDKPLTTTEIEILQAIADGDRSADVFMRGTPSTSDPLRWWRGSAASETPAFRVPPQLSFLASGMGQPDRSAPGQPRSSSSPLL